MSITQPFLLSLLIAVTPSIGWQAINPIKLLARSERPNATGEGERPVSAAYGAKSILVAHGPFALNEPRTENPTGLVRRLATDFTRRVAESIGGVPDEKNEISKSTKVVYAFLPLETLGPQPTEGAEIVEFDTVVPGELMKRLENSERSRIRVEEGTAIQVDTVSEGVKTTMFVYSPNARTLITATSAESLRTALRDPLGNARSARSLESPDTDKKHPSSWWGARTFEPNEQLGLSWRERNSAPAAIGVKVLSPTVSGPILLSYASNSPDELEKVSKEFTPYGGHVIERNVMSIKIRLDRVEADSQILEGLLIAEILGFGVAL